MLIKIYICTIIFTFVASIPYIVRLFIYDLKTDNKFMMMKINELYLAEISNSRLKRKMIFKELGFNITDFNLN